MLPQTRGAQFLYDSFLKDFLRSHEAKIDSALNKAKRSASAVGTEAVAAGADLASQGLSAAAKLAAANNSSKED